VALDGRLRFDNFVVGSGNRLAVAAARAVADAPGTVYNPLFIYSGSGLGKTHLMGAIGNQIAQRDRGPVEHVTLDDVVGELHRAVASGDIDQLRERYSGVSALLIDDVQFLTGHPETQSEVLRILNAIQARGAQIVMTSDRPPVEIADVDERLLTRMAGGLIVDIGPPDYETRMAIVRAKCDERGVRFRQGVIEELARLEFRNVRELQGALNRLIAVQTLGGEQIAPAAVLATLGDLAEARTIVDAPARGSSGAFQSFIDEIASAVAEHVEQWKVRIAEAVAYWSSEGYRTGLLDRLLQSPVPVQNVDAALKVFEERVQRLRALAREAIALDASLAEHESFFDPDLIDDAEALVARARRAAAPLPGPSAAFTRAGFEVGASNQLAVRAADAVVGAPGERYNPLFIHGPSGLGKTHLANAVGNGILAARGGTVACIPSQRFVDELVAALQDGTIERWRESYRGVDALVIDDIQFVAGKERTQEELFHVFNALYGESKQLVFVSDRPPRELTGLEERLRSRFEGGLVVQVQPPDRELRLRLYERFLTEAGGGAAAADVVQYLANRPASSVREIIGTVNRVIAAAEVAAVPPTLAFVKGELDPASQPAVADVLAAAHVGDTFFLDREKVIWEWPDPVARLVEG
jgi:chromosomal replication initiator protein DnaA